MLHYLLSHTMQWVYIYIYAPHRIPLPLLGKVKEEIDRMEKMGVITKIEEPTNWCAGMVVVPKKAGTVRICLDFTRMNESVCTEKFILLSVEHTLGMFNQLGRFLPNLTEKDKVLRDLLSKKNHWYWGTEQQAAFDQLKTELSSTPVLALYNPNSALKISADASSFGLGTVLLQKSDARWSPVAYASRHQWRQQSSAMLK